MTITVELPTHLRVLAGVDRSVLIDVNPPATQRSVIEALEAKFPALRGTIRNFEKGTRRPLVRFFACGEDISHQPIDSELPDAVTRGGEPFIILGAIAGGTV